MTQLEAARKGIVTAAMKKVAADENVPEETVRAAVATGVDGVFMETHMNPAVAKSDAANAIPFKQVERLWKTLIAIDKVVRAK